MNFKKTKTMKTAMQQLIDFLEPDLKMSDFLQFPAYEKAKELLEAEKEQIMEAFHKGQVSIFEIIKSKFPQHKFEATQHEVELIESGEENNEDAEKFYQQTYNTEQ